MVCDLEEKQVINVESRLSIPFLFALSSPFLSTTSNTILSSALDIFQCVSIMRSKFYLCKKLGLLDLNYLELTARFRAF